MLITLKAKMNFEKDTISLKNELDDYIITNDIENIKIYFYDKRKISKYIVYALRSSISYKNLLIYKYLVENYHNYIEYHDITYSLRVASEHGNLEIIKYILENHKDKLLDLSINTSFEIAARNGYLDVVRYITDKYTKEILDSYFGYSFAASVFYSRYDTVLYILTKYSRKIEKSKLVDAYKLLSSYNYDDRKEKLVKLALKNYIIYSQIRNNIIFC